jgi:dolichol kinase
LRANLARKSIHLAMTLVPLAGWWRGYWLALILAGLLLVASLLLESSRRWWPWVNRLLFKLLPTTFRSWEDRQILGSTWFSIGALAALLLFGLDAGGTAILFLAWGDPAAELVGRRWGSPGKRKTVAGSLGCLGACLLAGFLAYAASGLSPLALLVGALVATATERWSPPPDDNLWVPLFSAFVMVLVHTIGGGSLVLFPLWP